MLEAILAALGCDSSLDGPLPVLPLPVAKGPLLMVGSGESVGSGATKGFFSMLPSTIGGFVPGKKHIGL